MAVNFSSLKEMGQYFGVSVFANDDIPNIQSVLDSVASLSGVDMSIHVQPGSRVLNIFSYVGVSNGFNIDGPYAVGIEDSPIFVSSTQGLPSQYTEAMENVYINIGNTEDKAKILRTLVHEILHGSRHFDAARESVWDQFKNTTHPDLAAATSEDKSTILGYIEHALIGIALDRVSDLNPGYIDINGSGTSEHYFKSMKEVISYYEVNGSLIGWKSYAEINGLISSEDFVYNLPSGSNLTIDGRVIVWTDAYGYTGSTSVGSNYSQEMIDNYGIVDSGGHARMTLGGHIRAFGDFIGLDGEFGIQGNFSLNGEGQDGVAGSNGGSGSSLAPTTSPRPTPRPEGLGQPIIVDLDFDGIEVNTTGAVSFDLDSDGFREASAWVGADDGFLVIDRNSDDGSLNADHDINRTDEIILSMLTQGNPNDTDLEALSASLEMNSYRSTILVNGRQIQVLDSRDAGWVHMRVWQDRDQDGLVDTGELKTLDQLGITRINLGYDDGSTFSDKQDDITVGFSTLHGLGSYVRRTEGGGFETISGGVGDMSLGHNDLGWKRVDIISASGAVIGHEYQLETGERWRYAELAEPGSAAFNLTVGAYDAAQGDARNNDLNAMGSARAVQIAGGAGADTLRGGGSDDILSGEAGADSLMGNEGDDLLMLDSDDLASGFVDGGQGMDTLMVGDDREVNLILADHAAEAGIGGAGGDTISGTGHYGDVRISGAGGADVLLDGFGDDLLSGDDGNDTLTAAAGDDVLFGGVGLDKMYAGAGDDQLYGGGAADFLTGSSGDDYLSGGADSDTLLGGADDDRLFGGSGADSLAGETGDDTLEGGAGNDTLTFWRGDAELWGQDGNDTFQLADSTTTPRWGWMVLFGGKGNDTLKLDGISTDWNYQLAKTHVGGTQWQLYRQISSSEKMVIDLIDIETIIFSGVNPDLTSDDTTISLGNFGEGDTSDNYLRREWGDYIGDDQANGYSFATSGYTAGFYTNGVLNGWMGDDILSGAIQQIGGAEGNPYDGYADSIHGGFGADVISGLGGSDSLVGSNGADVVLAGDANDTVDGGAGADQASGGAGNDSLLAASGSDVVWGDAGNDSVYGGSGADVLIGGTGIDRLYGGSGSDQISGGDEGDSLYGDTGYDRLYGDGGNDALFGGAGSDYLYGGEGNDTLTGDDSLGSGFNYLAGGAGNDSLSGGAMDDQLAGEDGDDTLSGGEGRDVLMGGIGADLLSGGAGITDAVSYESSADAVSVNLATQVASGTDATGDVLSGFEQAIGGQGHDSLIGSAGDNMLGGSAGNDSLDGAAGDDDLFGGAGNDTLTGADGVDRLYGGEGDDAFFGGAGADTLDGGEGTDRIDFAAATAGVLVDLRDASNRDAEYVDDLYISLESVSGSNYGDTVFGGGENNTLSGRGGNDSLSGGGGADTLIGGGGRDTLAGGGAADVFKIASEAETAVGTGRDILLDFLSGTDDLDLSAIDASSALAGNQAFLFNGTAARANAVWYVLSGTDVIVRGDVTGDTTADFEIELKSVSALVAGDFLL